MSVFGFDNFKEFGAFCGGVGGGCIGTVCASGSLSPRIVSVAATGGAAVGAFFCGIIGHGVDCLFGPDTPDTPLVVEASHLIHQGREFTKNADDGINEGKRGCRNINSFLSLGVGGGMLVTGIGLGGILWILEAECNPQFSAQNAEYIRLASLALSIGGIAVMGISGYKSVSSN